MMYRAYQTQADVLAPLRAFAQAAAPVLGSDWFGAARSLTVRSIAAAYELVGRAGLRHGRPSFEIATTKVGERAVAVREEASFATPFGTLLRFRKDIELVQPRVLLVAPLSGHFATLLRGTVETLLPEHDVYITDWHNARDIPLSAGRFGFDDYVEHLIRFLEVLGPGAHVIAVCQPCVQALVAATAMAASNHPAQPRSLTLMAGPVDTRISPTEVNELATSRSIDWFEQTLLARVPPRFAGAGRRVYPGFVQLAAFMSMNARRHVKAHVDLYRALIGRELEKAAATKAFYDEYFAVLDLPAEFYIETVRMVFQEHLLPRGKLSFRGAKVDPGVIRRTALLTVEGEKDDICAVGQTLAAQELCRGLRPYLKRHHLQPGVGHYGVFSGRRWNAQIYPLVRNLILATD
jgi:poly(3-hydroxybutyrate) depolymerase